MRRTTFATAALAAAALTLVGCDQPKPRNPEPSAPAAGAQAPAKPAIPTVAEALPQPAWAAEVVGKNLRTTYPKEGTCTGNTDLVTKKYVGQPGGVEILGWGWDPAKKARVGKVVLIDRDYNIVGAGEGGVERPDVPPTLPEVTDPNSGFHAYTTHVAGPVDTYGVIGAGDTVCPLGHLEY